RAHVGASRAIRDVSPRLADRQAAKEVGMSASLTGQSHAQARAEPLPPFRELVWADLRAMAELKGARFPSPVALIDILLLPGTLTVLLFRLSCLFHHAGLRPVSRLLYIMNLVLFGADLAPGAHVGPGFVIPHPVGIGMANRVRLGR